MKSKSTKDKLVKKWQKLVVTYNKFKTTRNLTLILQIILYLLKLIYAIITK